MQFHHPIVDFRPPEVQDADKIGLSDTIVFLGSCFSENIGGELRRLYHPVVINPQGIAFDPFSICRHLTLASNTEFEIRPVSRDGLFFSWDHHSSLYATTIEGLKDTLQSAVYSTRLALEKATHVVITLGTVYYYRLAESGQPVANCHKMPSHYFRKSFLSVAETVEVLVRIYENINVINPTAKCIFTISPVKYLRDGIIENSRSKAHLIAAVHEVVNSCKASYFPAYELVTDVLRNYEYYEMDMAHPNIRAIRAVYNFFCESWVSAPLRAALQEIDGFLRMLHHELQHPESQAAKRWFVNLSTQLEKLRNKYPLELRETDKERWERLCEMFSP